jgi:hypothetical protein
MKIGDIVKSKNKSGQIKEKAKLVGILDANFYINYMLPKGFKLDALDTIWSKVCPNWKNENVAIILLDSPQRSATLEEWVESGMAGGFKKEDLERNYEEQCPMIPTVAVPIKDLKLDM